MGWEASYTRINKHFEKQGLSNKRMQHITHRDEASPEEAMSQMEVEHVTTGGKTCHDKGYEVRTRVMNKVYISCKRVTHVTQGGCVSKAYRPS